MRQKKFLLVDDDPDDCFLFQEVLSDLSPAVHLDIASDGQEALERLKKMEVLPDIIFLDLNMPRMDGKQCLFELKRNPQYRNVPVFIYTTSSHSKDIEEAIQSGAACFITKPASIHELRQMLSIIMQNLNDMKRMLHLLSGLSVYIIC